MLYYKVCRSYQNVPPSPVLVRDPIKPYFWFSDWLVNLCPIRMRGAFLQSGSSGSVLWCMCCWTVGTSPHSTVCANCACAHLTRRKVSSEWHTVQFEVFHSESNKERMKELTWRFMAVTCLCTTFFVHLLTPCLAEHLVPCSGLILTRNLK